MGTISNSTVLIVENIEYYYGTINPQILGEALKEFSNVCNFVYEGKDYGITPDDINLICTEYNAKVKEYNQFHGKDHPNQQVLKSAAGYYIGDLYYDEEMKGYFPYSRDSQEYWATREEAQHALDNDLWSPKF